MRTLLSFVFFLVLPAAAQELQLAPIRSGAVFNSPDHSVRLILGVAGAAYLSAPVLDRIDAASIAPDGSRALAIRDGKLFLASGLQSDNPTLDDTGAACADLVSWSADSSSAAVYCRATGSVQLLAQLQSQPLQARDLDVSAGGSPLTALAVAPAGASVAAAFDAGGIWTFAPGETPHLLSASPASAALAYSPTGDSLFAAGRDSCAVLQIRNLATAAETDVFAMPSAPACGPTGIAFAARGTRLLLADAAARTVRAFDLRDRSAAGEFPLDISPTTLQPLTSGSLFLIRSAGSSGEPFFVFNAAQSSLYFVPAAGGAQ
jgi:hypothetical protein